MDLAKARRGVLKRRYAVTSRFLVLLERLELKFREPRLGIESVEQMTPVLEFTDKVLDSAPDDDRDDWLLDLWLKSNMTMSHKQLSEELDKVFVDKGWGGLGENSLRDPLKKAWKRRFPGKGWPGKRGPKPGKRA